ncbi:prenyltransferase [Bacillus piscicola]|uniref:prenyltransferase n=1 Tax=Bacillus piscicola TaxID=1632684 RepID=UPI001F08D378|nr:prenyltransferase [Bacillus piscicola]
MSQPHANTFVYRYSWIRLIRPLTFTGSIMPVLAATGLAFRKGSIDFVNFAAFLCALLLIQAAVNIFNDYYDFLHGQDAEKWLVQSANEQTHGLAPATVRNTALLLLVAAATIGIWLAWQTGWWILGAGAVGVLAGYCYSAGAPLSALGLGEGTAALFLGIVPFSLAYIVQGLVPNLQILFVSLPFAVLIATMILTNNIRDIDKDLPFRSTLPIKIGKRNAIILLMVLLTLSYLLIFIMIAGGILPLLTLITILAVPLAVRLVYFFSQREFP